MNYKAHVYAACLSGSAYLLLSDKNALVALPLVLVSSGLGGLAPDLDKQGSRISNKAKISSFIIEHVTGHRGLLHTPFFVGLLYLTFKILQVKYIFLCDYEFYFICFIIGYLSHLFLDFLTPKGIMLFYPFSFKYKHIIGLKSRFKDLLVIIIFTILFLLLFLFVYDFL